MEKPDIQEHEGRELALLARAGDPQSISVAAGFLRAGQAVVFPTDTVYGVGVVASSGIAIERLYALKGRSLDKGIPVLLAEMADVERVCRFVSPTARTFMERHWPGALTLVVPRRTDLPTNLSPNPNVAIRIPDHDVARALVRAAGGALATTSANLSGQEPARSGIEAFTRLGYEVSAVLDDGPSPGNAASTIVDCTVDPPAILRAGPVSAAALGLEEALRTRI